MSVESIPTILSIVFALMSVLLAAALSTVVYFVIHSLKSLSNDVGSMRTEVGEITGQLRTEARQDRSELRDGLRRVHERIDVVPHQFVKREDCIIARNQLTEAVTRVDDKLGRVLGHLNIDVQGGGT